jgi:hypothetical protein
MKTVIFKQTAIYYKKNNLEKEKQNFKVLFNVSLIENSLFHMSDCKLNQVFILSLNRCPASMTDLMQLHTPFRYVLAIILRSGTQIPQQW